MLQSDSDDATLSLIPEIKEVEALANDLMKLLVRSEQELIKGDAREQVEKLERWVTSYRNGLYAARKISQDGSEILHKTRDQLKLALDEQLRLENEGGNLPATKEQDGQIEQLSSALRHIDRMIPVIDQSFQSPVQELENS